MQKTQTKNITFRMINTKKKLINQSGIELFIVRDSSENRETIKTIIMIDILWRDSSTKDKALVSISSWNAKIISKKLDR